MKETIKIGQTCVRVMRIDMNEQTRKETTIKCNEGIVVEDSGSFVRVFNPAHVDKGGDISPEMSQRYPLAARRMWCEHVKDREMPITVPVRFHSL